MGRTRVVDRPNAAELEAAFALRYRVFVIEQQVPLELERDALDATARHVVVFEADTPEAVATGRLVLHGEDAKVQRVAVDAARRGEGLGRLVMDRLQELAAQAGAARVVLASQVSAIPFYERLGYEAWGGVFLDAGIEHRWMGRPVGPPASDLIDRKEV